MCYCTLIIFFVLGHIRYWNDSRILADNTPQAQTLLKTIKSQIHPVARTDSSGTTSIFTSALASFSPAVSSSFDSSFTTSVTASQTPFWCGLLTDEIQIITINGCVSNQLVNMTIVGSDYKLRSIEFSCDIDQTTFQSLFQSNNGNNKAIHITKTLTGVNTNVFTIGYMASVTSSSNKPLNWYQPYINQVASGLTVTVTTLQEGSYVNSPYVTKTILPEIKSIWVNQQFDFSFNISYNGIVSNTFNSLTITPATLQSALINIVPNGIISSVINVTHSGSIWKEYRITFTTSATFVSKILQVLPMTNETQSLIAVMTLTTSNNYPIFYDSVTVYGYSKSGKYSCYKRELNYTQFSVNTGYGNSGVISEVLNIPYSIGYSVLDDALNANLAISRLINLAGFFVIPLIINYSLIFRKYDYSKY